MKCLKTEKNLIFFLNFKKGEEKKLKLWFFSLIFVCKVPFTLCSYEQCNLIFFCLTRNLIGALAQVVTRQLSHFALVPFLLIFQFFFFYFSLVVIVQTRNTHKLHTAFITTLVFFLPFFSFSLVIHHVYAQIWTTAIHYTPWYHYIHFIKVFKYVM